MTTHTEAWKRLKVRPVGGSYHPERTRLEYCVYDRVHGDDVYTCAWLLAW